jgi:hypothetical protein
VHCISFTTENAGGLLFGCIAAFICKAWEFAWNLLYGHSADLANRVKSYRKHSGRLSDEINNLQSCVAFVLYSVRVHTSASPAFREPTGSSCFPPIDLVSVSICLSNRFSHCTLRLAQPFRIHVRSKSCLRLYLCRKLGFWYW